MPTIPCHPLGRYNQYLDARRYAKSILFKFKILPILSVLVYNEVYLKNNKGGAGLGLENDSKSLDDKDKNNNPWERYMLRITATNQD
jgi:hypothetical protein